jgi:membrane protease YdiL (CAAX protease family)
MGAAATDSPYSSWLSLVLKVVLFGIPAYLLPRFMDTVAANRSLLLDRAPSAAWIGVSTAVLVLYALFVDRGQAGLHSISIFFVISALVVSLLVEEIMFRGSVLQQLTRQLPFALGNLVTSLLFLLYHIPAWMVRDQSISLLGSLWIVVVSLWLGYSLHRSRSL